MQRHLSHSTLTVLMPRYSLVPERSLAWDLMASRGCRAKIFRPWIYKIKALIFHVEPFATRDMA